MIEIKSVTTYEMVIDLNKFHAWYKNRIFSVALTVAIAVVTLGWGTYITIYQQKIILGTTLILTGVLYLLSYPLLHPLMFHWTMDKIVRILVNRSGTFKENIHYFFELDNKNFNCTSVTGQEEEKFSTEWNGIVHIYETKKTFYIYKSNKEAYIIPKEDCLSNIGKLRELFTEVLGNKFKKIAKF